MIYFLICGCIYCLIIEIIVSVICLRDGFTEIGIFTQIPKVIALALICNYLIGEVYK